MLSWANDDIDILRRAIKYLGEIKMGRLNESRCYLAGCIEHAKDGGAHWRDKIQQELLDLNITWLNPVKKPSTKHLEDETTLKTLYDARNRGDYDEIKRIMSPIRSFDLRLVDISDFIVVHLDDNIPTCGTYEEIFWANRSKKPIIVHHEQGKKAISHWLFGALPHKMFFGTWEEVYQYIRSVDQDEIVEELDRWRFYDLSLCRQFNG